jgi:hypothetical protein
VLTDVEEEPPVVLVLPADLHVRDQRRDAHDIGTFAVLLPGDPQAVHLGVPDLRDLHGVIPPRR